MALSVSRSNVGKAAASQVLNRVCIVQRPEGEGGGRGTGLPHRFCPAPLSWRCKLGRVDGTKGDLGLCYIAQI